MDRLADEVPAQVLSPFSPLFVLRKLMAFSLPGNGDDLALTTP